MERTTLYTGMTIVSLVILAIVYHIQPNRTPAHLQGEAAVKIKSTYSPQSIATTAEERDAYFFSLLRDPAQNKIPDGIRAKELDKYQSLITEQLKSAVASDYTWSEAGPIDVGGRTRALAIDVRNSDVLLAGGVSGGVWKSTDKGQSWSLKNSPAESYSVTSICQDIRPGSQDTWYYACGEYWGNSANAPSTSYLGHGLYISEDNGENWQAILGTDSSPYEWDDDMDYVSKIMVDPVNGDLYIAAHGYGLLLVRKESDVYILNPVLGGLNQHTFCDFDMDAAGNKLVVLSELGFTPPTNTPGVYYAASGSFSYTQIDATSSSFPTTHQRSLIRFAPSDPTIAYVFTTIDEGDVAFHKIDIDLNSLIDHSANLPNFSGNHGKLGPQGNYNMTLAVKPDDANFIVIGSTSLFRSNDAFATTPSIHYGWIGGYGPDGGNSIYNGHHPDCHISVFDPAAPAALWSGHDGGLSYVSDITQSTTTTQLMPWEDMNNGYNVTQFYTLANPVRANDDRYIGGTQDNGSPYFKWDVTSGTSEDISSGDGAYCHVGKNYMYVSTQYGKVMRVGYDAEGDPLNPYSSTGPYDWSSVYPSDASEQLFINPFIMNPNDENMMVYAGGTEVWMNKAIEAIPIYNTGGTTTGWYAPTALSVPGYTVSALALSKVPGNVLYYAANSFSDLPKVYRVDNSTAEEADLIRQDISVPGASSGSYPYFIAVNPFDANEIIIVFSNYGVPSIFHSSDGGANYTQIDGNLTATPSVPGPSMRSAAIHYWDGKLKYFISTSIGVYETSILDGGSTEWQNIAPSQLGNVVCNRVKSNEYDGKVVTATHGRGIFVGTSDNPLFINTKLPNLIKLTTSPNSIIDVSDVFGHGSAQPVSVSVASNSDPTIVSHNLIGNNLTLNYSAINTGTAIITLRGTNDTDMADMAFAVTVEEDPSTNIIDDFSETKTDISLYPNPTTGTFKINAEKYQNNATYQVNIYAASGAMVYSHSFKSGTDLTNHRFDLSDQSPGIYILSISSNELTYHQKLHIK
ncbi:MAG: T9SS type A sorting domain-containing protein [Marinilabiliaceae bacterium]|nr:T9SS type A sorting domain-containing protein [Marinilabiliaceae bacterium]